MRVAMPRRFNIVIHLEFLGGGEGARCKVTDRIDLVFHPHRAAFRYIEITVKLDEMHLLRNLLAVFGDSAIHYVLPLVKASFAVVLAHIESSPVKEGHVSPSNTKKIEELLSFFIKVPATKEGQLSGYVNLYPNVQANFLPQLLGIVVEMVKSVTNYEASVLLIEVWSVMEVSTGYLTGGIRVLSFEEFQFAFSMRSAVDVNRDTFHSADEVALLKSVSTIVSHCPLPLPLRKCARLFRQQD